MSDQHHQSTSRSRYRSRIGPATAVVLALAVVGGACGSSDGGEAAPTTSPSASATSVPAAPPLARQVTTRPWSGEPRKVAARSAGAQPAGAGRAIAECGTSALAIRYSGTEVEAGSVTYAFTARNITKARCQVEG
jgi:hypothetical protein